MKLASINLPVEICTAVFDPPSPHPAGRRQIRPCHFDLQVDFVRPQRHKYNQKSVDEEAFYPRVTLRGVLEMNRAGAAIGRSDKPAVAFLPGGVQNVI